MRSAADKTSKSNLHFHHCVILIAIRVDVDRQYVTPNTLTWVTTQTALITPFSTGDEHEITNVSGALQRHIKASGEISNVVL